LSTSTFGQRGATIIRVIFAALVLVSATAARAQSDPSSADETAIRGVVDSFMDAWNQHDAKAFGALFAEDADFFNIRGIHERGRKRIEDFHAPLFATIFKSSHQTADEISVRFVKPDVAEVDVRWGMTGALNPDGSPRPLRHGLLNFIMTKEAGRWQILVMHNLDLTPS
jgi:uncharacterized protein (TIGR02246 family)